MFQAMASHGMHASLVCNECQGMFPSAEALGAHLMWHNQLKAFQGVSNTAPPPAPVTVQAPVQTPVVTQTAVCPAGSWVPGVVDHYDNAKGFGFIRRSTPGAPLGQVYFHRDVVKNGPVLKRGDAVTFIEQLSRKRGPRAASVRVDYVPPTEAHGGATRPAAPVDDVPMVPGVVSVYATGGGYGTIIKLDGSSSPTVNFSIHACDFKRPPPTAGEHVMIRETTGPKGPTAAIVIRTAVAENPTAKKKTKPKPAKIKTNVAPLALPGDVALAALMRAMNMIVNSPRAMGGSPHGRRGSFGGKRAARPRADSELTPEKYLVLIDSLSSGAGGELYVPAGVALLARSQPLKALSIGEIRDRETQAMMLAFELENELDQCQRRLLLEQAERGPDEHASLLDFGYTGLLSPVVRQVEREREPEPPKTMHCGICMDDVEIEEIFFVTGCDHTYCRDCFHSFVVDRIEAQVVMPTCPHDGCETIVSDGDLTMVLTMEEQENYYKVCQDLAIASVPGLFQCLQPDCRGMGALAPDDPHFVCPMCRAERCVQCNTSVWHADMTCEQLRQRTKDNELHPEQLRQIYGNNIYQCGRCSYGPILHAYCSNLASHQGELVGNARINNGCPRCQWFANDISQWPRWNDQLHPPIEQPQA